MTREEMIKTLLTQLKSRMPVYLRIEKLNLLRDLSYKEKREDLLKQSCAAIIDLINENLKDFDEKQQRKCYEMLRDAYTQLGRYNFHAFLIAMEWNRQVEKRFYQPRMKVLRQVVTDLQDLADGKINIYSLSLPPRVGKLLSDDTPVLTSAGWKRHGDLKVGDEVINPDGEYVKVTHVHPKYHTTHTVTISDGSKFDCHFRHEWRVYDRRSGKWRTLETQDMIGKLKNGKHFNFMLENKVPFKGRYREDLAVDPYTLGVWLGDGSNNNPRITMKAEDKNVVDKIQDNGYKLKHVYVHKTTKVPTYEFENLRFDLQKYDMCHSRKRKDKHIPEEYLTASLEQRLELLAGLLDTDGCLREKEHRYDFVTSDEELKESFISLVSTFGWRCSVTTISPKMSSSGIQGRKQFYCISFNPTMFIPCVLKRKQLTTFSKQRRLSIVSIEESEHKQGNCITVERDGMYCVGKRLIPTHNTTLGLFFITFMMGRYPDEHVFAVGYVSGLVGTFYQGVKDFIESNEYRFYDIFPELKSKLEVSAEDRTLHLGKSGERYKSATFRSVDGQITGALEASSLLYMDDMCSGIEEAMNIDRLNKLWNKVSVDVMQRRVHNPRTHKLAPILMIGTIWSIHDPISRTKNEHHDEPDYRERVMPALNEFQESNFDYDYSVGFTTQMYLELKRGMDDVSWECVYQQNPMERDGLLFPNGSLRRYLQLPKEPPDSIMAFCDVAFGGEDYLSFPIAYIWGEDGYIVDVVFRSRASYEATEPIVAAKIVQHGVQIAKFEANNGGDFYARDVSDMVDESNHRCNIVWERAGTKQSKLTRIIQFAPDIKSWYYKDPSMYTPKEDYGLFMTNLTTFVQTGSSPHDDAPDSMAGLSKMRKIPVYGQISSRAGIRSGF